MLAEAYWRFRTRADFKSLRRLVRRSCVRAGKFSPLDKSKLKAALAPCHPAISNWLKCADANDSNDASPAERTTGSGFGVMPLCDAGPGDARMPTPVAESIRMAWNNAVTMVDTVHRLSLLIQQEKLHSLRRLAYGASHEINNPLANIATRAQTLLANESDPDRRDRLAVIYAQAMRAHDMISDMMLFANPPEAELELTDLVKLSRSAVEELRSRLMAQGVAVRVVEYPDVDPTCVDPGQMTMVLRNLIENSINAMSGPGEIRIRVFRESPHWIGLSIVDTGPGFTTETAASAFDPFHSDREAGRGLGFGLSKAWRYLDQMGGRIFIDTGFEGGGKIEIRIPFRTPAARRIDRPIAA